MRFENLKCPKLKMRLWTPLAKHAALLNMAVFKGEGANWFKPSKNVENLLLRDVF